MKKISGIFSLILKPAIIIICCILFFAWTSCISENMKSEEFIFAPSEIVQSQIMSGILSDDKNWRNETTHVRFITKNEKFPVKAEVEVGIDPSPSGFNTQYFPYKFPNAPHYKRCSLSIENCKRLLRDYDRISLMVYPDMPDRASLWFEAIGASEWLGATFPLQPGKWNKIYLNLSHLTPEKRQCITRLMIGGTPIGLLPGDPQWQRYYIKDLCFEQVLPRSIKGWEVSAPYVSISQVGFTPWHKDKSAIFSNALAAKDFSVRNASDGKVIYQGKITELKNAFGNFKLADFSDLKQPGSYYVEADGCRSVVFPITESPLNDAAKKYLHYLYCVRSGMATPAHSECFLDDMVREDTKKSLDLHGGWFDASDLRIYIGMSMTNIFRPLAIVSSFPLSDPETEKALREEAQWGAKFFNKIWDNDTGLPFTTQCVHIPNSDKYKPIRGQYYKNNNYWTDNKPDTEDDRVVHTPWNSEDIDGILDNYIHHLGICAAGANFLVEGKSSDEAIKKMMLDHIERHFKRLRDSDFVKKNQRFLPGASLYGTPQLALSLEIEILLAEYTGKKEYVERALTTAGLLFNKYEQVLVKSENGDMIAALMEKNVPCSYLGSLTLKPVEPIETLVRLLESSILVPDYYKYYAMIKIYADMYSKKIYKHSQPYSIPIVVARNKAAGSRLLGKGMTDKKEELYISGYSCPADALGFTSYKLSKMAVLLNDPELHTLAVNMLYWQLGKNPFSQSLIADVGEDYKPDLMSTALGFMPGMMSIGIDMKDGIPFLPQQYGKNEIYSQLTPYLQALIIADSPCSLNGKITANNLPVANKKLRIFNKEFNKEYFIETDSQGKFADCLIPGGIDYGISTDNELIGSVSAISGMRKVFNRDLANDLEILTVKTPDKIMPGEVFDTELEIFCYGQNEQEFSIEAHGYNVDPVAESRSFTLKPGKQNIKFSFKASSQANIPYLVMFNRKTHLKDISSASGLIMK